MATLSPQLVETCTIATSRVLGTFALHQVCRRTDGAIRICDRSCCMKLFAAVTCSGPRYRLVPRGGVVTVHAAQTIPNAFRGGAVLQFEGV